MTIRTNRHRKLRAAAFGAALVTLCFAADGDVSADLAHANYLTFNRAVALPGAILPAGSYTFEVANPDSGANVVRVTSRPGRKVHYQGFTIRVDRPARLAEDTMVAFGEAPRGEPVPITVWFPLGESSGHQFLYR